jgi:hypothetical protein
MTGFDKWERRFGWLAFPHIIRYYALLHVLVYVLQIVRPDLQEVLDFDRARIFSGEVWRVFTFYFAASRFGGVSPITLLFLFFAVSFMFMVSDGLEGAWGSFKTSLFCYFGMLMILLANFVLPMQMPYSGLMIYSSAFLSFATLYPKVEIRLFMIIPVQVGFLGAALGVYLLATCLFSPSSIPFHLFVVMNYLLWAGIPALRGTARVVKSAQRRSKFKAASKPEEEAFHKCEVCGRTDASDPELDFRVCEDGREFCAEHLPER